MNPVDHPMGGRGKGRGMPSTSPWGKITKGVFTVKKEKCKYIIKPRPTKNRRKKQPVRGGRFAIREDLADSLFDTAPPSIDTNTTDVTAEVKSTQMKAKL